MTSALYMYVPLPPTSHLWWYCYLYVPTFDMVPKLVRLNMMDKFPTHELS